MKPALCLCLGIALGWVQDAPSPSLKAALADHARTTAELRASSAKLRANCIGPKWQRMPYRSETT
jgi:hypothetical protein